MDLQHSVNRISMSIIRAINIEWHAVLHNSTLAECNPVYVVTASMETHRSVCTALFVHLTAGHIHIITNIGFVSLRNGSRRAFHILTSLKINTCITKYNA